MRNLIACLAVSLAAGCGGTNEPKTEAPRVVEGPKAKPAPKPGDKVIAPDATGSLWGSLEGMRTKAPKSLIIDIWPGYLMEVIEVGDDYAAVNVIRDKDGEAVNRHGYTRPWWK